MEPNSINQCRTGGVPSPWILWPWRMKEKPPDTTRICQSISCGGFFCMWVLEVRTGEREMRLEVGSERGGVIMRKVF